MSDETHADGMHLTVLLSCTRRGARLARLLTVAELASRGLPTDTAAHVVGELAANAALHGRVPGRSFRLRASCPVPGSLRIEVTDALGERAPRLATLPVGPDAESGRGLLLVEALAERWGVTHGPFPCKTVWAEVALVGVSPPRRLVEAPYGRRTNCP
ncbi:ATP-binding protein [Streptomyces diacarni]|uniref:ATP-binding protein n=1 Tax=Streptomyces diacarni TaxID=2800381 RepID=A0A367ESP9_9ACTN|nr:ATP-binding protein [Streptomyces diacarni]RCG20739.1 ATP-binding protein [Streptomyces diacarni]